MKTDLSGSVMVKLKGAKFQTFQDIGPTLISKHLIFVDENFGDEVKKCRTIKTEILDTRQNQGGGKVKAGDYVAIFEDYGFLLYL